MPSFALMDIQGPVIVTYVYQLVEGEVRVEKVEWRKETVEPAPQAAALGTLQLFGNHIALLTTTCLGATSLPRDIPGSGAVSPPPIEKVQAVW